MKRIIIGLAIALLCVLTISAVPQSKTTWEYKTEEKCFDEKRMNALGGEGWELAGFAETDRGAWHCIFKRSH